MSMCIRINNFCRTQAYNAYSGILSRADRIGAYARNLGAAVSTIPTALRQIAAAGASGSLRRTTNIAAEGAFQGAITGLCVATSAAGAADAIPLACGTILSLSTDFPYRVPRPLRPVVGLAPIPAAVGGLGFIANELYNQRALSAGTAFVYFQMSASLAGPVRGRIHGGNGEQTKSFHLQMLAGLAAGVGSAYLGLAPGESVVIAGLAAGAATEMRSRVTDFGLLSKRQVVGTGLAAGSAVAGFAIAGPVGAIGAGTVTGAFLNTVAKMFDFPAHFLAPIVQHFEQAKDELLRKAIMQITKQELVANEPELRDIPATFILAYAGDVAALARANRIADARWSAPVEYTPDLDP